MLFFLLGAASGALALFWLGVNARARADRIEEEKLVLAQEKQLVVDFMHHMVQALGEGLSREDLFQRIVHAAILCTGALSACIFEKRSDDKMQGVAVEGLFPPHRPLPPQAKAKLTTRARFIEQVLKSEVFDLSEGLVGQVARTGVGVLIADAAADARIVKHDDPALAVRSVIAAPIRFQDRTIGVLAVTNPADGLPFTASDFSLVMSLAEQAGLAVHNLESLNFQIEKKQLDLDLSLASGIQQMLLPGSTPQVAGLDIAAQYVPTQKVGGDLYDFFQPVADAARHRGCRCVRQGDSRLAAHGDLPDEPAADRSALRLPGRWCSARSTATMAGEVCRGMFITIIYAVVDVVANTVTFARAGHELPLFSRRDPVTGQPLSEFVGSEGMSVGMVDPAMFDSVIEDRTIPFLPGDSLVLYTDGVTEAANDEEKEFSGSRLADTLRTLRSRSASEITEGIVEHVRRFSGQDHHRDDLTLVTVKRV